MSHLSWADNISWHGRDIETGVSIEIGVGNLVRTGQEIEIYDYATNQYHDIEIQSTSPIGNSSLELYVFDFNTNTYRTLEME